MAYGYKQKRVSGRVLFLSIWAIKGYQIRLAQKLLERGLCYNYTTFHAGDYAHDGMKITQEQERIND
ncbi:unnamed protein product [Kuraishia capsulata CBS 1993]|uniref:Uncharacterized protein n=1 Tax=Kuraishia capsulata CBS 1993 TaxID=1382522 RepID=W6MST0_9ASCO|nr:uncharacterized protein KUCA_T00005411001 [Kuraishia capsulata CBS 1993]CDK29423.1 unnamed protein product [Kuraishia capsulata CBS 1993]